METYNSQIRVGQEVSFPAWQGERHYMLPFTLNHGLPATLGRFQATVNQMMDGIEVAKDQDCYLMVDEQEIIPGNFHRRPGLHVDGYWHANIQCYGECTHSPGPSHKPRPTHRPRPNHSPTPRHTSSGNASEGLLLASNYSACRAVVGEYRRNFLEDWRGGDCSDLNVQGMSAIMLQANRAYHMHVMTLHESLVITEPVKRTLIRINAPNQRNICG